MLDKFDQPIVSPILKNGYASTIVVNVLTKQNWRSPQYPELDGIFMMPVPRVESRRLKLPLGSGIVSISVESGKSAEHETLLASRELLGVHYTAERAAEFLGMNGGIPWSEKKIAKATFTELMKYWPDFDARQARYRGKRWRNALPLMKPGHVRDLSKFWAEQESDRDTTIYVAGDQTNFST